MQPVISRRVLHTTSRNLLEPQHMEVLGDSSFWTAVETFDGSTIIDPVVVSNAFWDGLASRMISLLIGQFLAFVAFSVIVAVASSQVSKAADFVSNTFGQSVNSMREEAVRDPTNGFRNPSTAAPVQADLKKLALCLFIDIVGSSSELIPVIGEITDALYAPIAAILLRQLYGSNVAGGLEFVEEILPFTDIIPFATICWVVDTYSPASDLARFLQLGVYSTQIPPEDKESAIEVNGTSLDSSTWNELKSNKENGSFR